MENTNSVECQHKVEERRELYEKVKKDGSSAITLVDEVKMFPTPRARDWKDGYTVPPSVKNGTRAHTLGTFIAEKEIMCTNTDNKGVRTRINGSDNDLQKESGSRGDDRTTSRADVGMHTKTTKNGEMGLSQKEMFPKKTKIRF